MNYNRHAIGWLVGWLVGWLGAGESWDYNQPRNTVESRNKSKRWMIIRKTLPSHLKQRRRRPEELRENSPTRGR
jgi:hypothetical protein